MAERPVWRGQLRLALVSCPVALYPARRERGGLHFNFINPETGNRIRMASLDAKTGEELNRSDLVRGYQYKKNQYVLLDESDFANARIDTSTTMTITKFVPADSIDPIYYDASYFVAPDGRDGLDVYAVLHAAIAASDRVALARVVISRRERVVAIMPYGRGLIAHTLHEAQDIANPEPLFETVPDAPPDKAMVTLARQLIDRQTDRYVASDTEDRYEARLRALIEAKAKGEGLTPAAEDVTDRGNVIDLMAALKRSLGETAAPARKQSAPKPKSAKPMRAKAASVRGRTKRAS